jgi:hypothetical protein
VLAFWGYLWWQTRDLRRQMRARIGSDHHPVPRR